MATEIEIAQAAQAITEIARQTSLYEDLVQGTAKEVGETMRRVVRAALLPVRSVVWGVEHFENTFVPTVARMLKARRPTKIIPADPIVAGPAIEALKFAGHQAHLRDMYASLLATSMDYESAKSAHPAYVEIIRQMAPDEARICEALVVYRQSAIVDIEVIDQSFGGLVVESRRNLSWVAVQTGLAHDELAPSYIDNLLRLNIIDRPHGLMGGDEGHYRLIHRRYKTQRWMFEMESQKEKITFAERRGIVRTTNFGHHFLLACVMPVANDRHYQQRKSG